MSTPNPPSSTHTSRLASNTPQAATLGQGDATPGQATSNGTHAAFAHGFQDDAQAAPICLDTPGVLVVADADLHRRLENMAEQARRQAHTGLLIPQADPCQTPSPESPGAGPVLYAPGWLAALGLLGTLPATDGQDDDNNTEASHADEAAFRPVNPQPDHPRAQPHTIVGPVSAMSGMAPATVTALAELTPHARLILLSNDESKAVADRAQSANPDCSIWPSDVPDATLHTLLQLPAEWLDEAEASDGSAAANDNATTATHGEATDPVSDKSAVSNNGVTNADTATQNTNNQNTDPVATGTSPADAAALAWQSTYATATTAIPKGPAMQAAIHRQAVGSNDHHPANRLPSPKQRLPQHTAVHAANGSPIQAGPTNANPTQNSEATNIQTTTHSETDATPAAATGHLADLGTPGLEAPICEPNSDEPFNALGDTDLVDAILQGRRQLKDQALALMAQQSPLVNPRLTQQPTEHSVPMGRFGHLTAESTHGKNAIVDELEAWAPWLSKWLTLDHQMHTMSLLAMRDELTGVWNRRYFNRFLNKVLTRAAQQRLQVTVLVFDIDDFKRYNDQYGHAAGDEILTETAKLMQSVVREHDVVARIGGDEFAVIFWEAGKPQKVNGRKANSRHPHDVMQAAGRFQHAVCQHQFSKLGAEAPGTLTISGGLASFPWDGRNAEELLAVADQMAYKSKRQGKNAITFGPGTQVEANQPEDAEPQDTNSSHENGSDASPC